MEHTPLDAVIQAHSTTNTAIEQLVRSLATNPREEPNDRERAEFDAAKLTTLMAVQTALDHALREFARGNG